MKWLGGKSFGLLLILHTLRRPYIFYPFNQFCCLQVGQIFFALDDIRWSSQSWNSSNMCNASLRTIQSLIHIQCLNYCCQIRLTELRFSELTAISLTFPYNMLLTLASNIMNNGFVYLNTNKCSQTQTSAKSLRHLSLNSFCKTIQDMCCL